MRILQCGPDGTDKHLFKWSIALQMQCGRFRRKGLFVKKRGDKRLRDMPFFAITFQRAPPLPDSHVIGLSAVTQRGEDVIRQLYNHGIIPHFLFHISKNSGFPQTI